MEQAESKFAREDAPVLFSGGAVFFLLFGILFYFLSGGHWVYAVFLAALSVGALSSLCRNELAKSLGYLAAFCAALFWIPFHGILAGRLVSKLLEGGGVHARLLRKAADVFVVPQKMNLPELFVFAIGFVVLSVLAVKLAGLLPEKMRMPPGVHKFVVFCVRFSFMLLWAGVCGAGLYWLLLKLSFSPNMSFFIFLLPLCFLYRTWRRSSEDVDRAAPDKTSDTDAKPAVKAMDIPDMKLCDVAGMKEAKEQIMLRAILPLRNRKTAESHGISPGGGILLYGPPGTGKTFLARAVAGELGVPFYTLDVADVFSKYVGESEQNIKNFFTEIRKNPLSVLFIDELETIFHKRTDDIHETSRKVISILLQELDGVRSGGGRLLLIGATNTPQMIDEAFLRAGRFDVQIFVDLPDAGARLQILRANFKGVKYPVDPRLLEKTAEVTQNFSGADLKGLAERVRQKAFARGVKRYTVELFNESLREIRPASNAEIMRQIREWEARRKGF